MTAFINHQFNDAFEVRVALESRNKASTKRAGKTLIENNANEGQLARFASITGNQDPPSIACGAMAQLRNFGADRMMLGFEEIVRISGVNTFDYLVFEEHAQPEAGNCLFNLRTRASPLHPQLKRNYSHCVGMFRSAVGPFGITPSLRVIGLKVDGQPTAIVPRSARTAEVAPKDKVTLPATSVGIAAAVASLWEMTAIEDLVTHGLPGEEGLPTLKSSARRLELDNFLVQAQLPIKRSLFGHGAGKRLVRNVIREVDARAASLDLMASSPLQVEGVAAFLAELPYNKEGTRCVLPVVRPL